jgi:hypothetical protein
VTIPNIPHIDFLPSRWDAVFEGIFYHLETFKADIERHYFSGMKASRSRALCPGGHSFNDKIGVSLILIQRRISP